MTVAAYTPHGADFAHSETTDAFDKSATEVMRNGLPGFTTSCIEFLANTFEEALEAAKSDHSSDWRILDDPVEYEVVD